MVTFAYSEPHPGGCILLQKNFFSIAVNPLLSDMAPHFEHEIAPDDPISSALVSDPSVSDLLHPFCSELVKIAF